MFMKSGLLAVALLLGLTVCRVPAGETGNKEEVPAGEGTVVLDTGSFWRCHITLRPSVWGTAAQPQPRPPEVVCQVNSAAKELNPHSPGDPRAGAHVEPRRKIAVLSSGQPFTPAPPKDWTAPEFDDSAWWRTSGAVFGAGGRWERWGDTQPSSWSYGNYSNYCGPTETAVLSFRGRFLVTDPQKVKDLCLSLAYRGGAVVYLNGKEIARGHIQAGSVTPETLAEDHPEAAYSIRNDMVRTHGGAVAVALEYRRPGRQPKDDKQRAQMEEGERQIKVLETTRIRRLENVGIPAGVLRKGVNVLAFEIHRAALRKENPFTTCALVEVRLAAGQGDGLEPGTAPPKGLRAWPADVMEDILITSYGDPADHVPPVKIVGTRNGAFTGQFVVSSDAVIRNLKVEAGDLVQKDGKGKLPSSALRFMFGRPAGRTGPHDGPLKYLGLSDKCPAEVGPVMYLRYFGSEARKLFASPVQPVWLTISVPADAAAGQYQGRCTVRADGAAAIEVPVELKVCGWKLPDGKDYATFVDFAQSPETLSLYYGVKPWSDEHFKLIDRSFELLGSAGNKTVYVPLIATTHFGNEESMVRWIRKGDGAWGYDFSVMEKYLDVYEKRCGKPVVLYLYVYDFFLGTAGSEHHGGDSAVIGSISTDKTPPVPVTVMDAPGGAAKLGEAPAYVDPNAEKAWKPLADELMKRLKARGMDKALLLAFTGDLAPPKPYVEFWDKMLPGAKWASHSHEFADKLYGKKIIGLTTSANMVEMGIDPVQERYYGWNVSEGGVIWTLFPRYSTWNGWPRPYFRVLEELVITGRSAGAGRLPGDFFGRRTGKEPLPTYDRYPRGWANMSIGKVSTWLAPGPDGPVTTVPFDLFREGVQECQGRIFIEKALLDPAKKASLGADLAKRAQEMLDERTRAILWIYCQPHFMLGGRVPTVLPGSPLPAASFAGSGWQSRSEELFSAAAEVAAVLGSQ